MMNVCKCTSILIIHVGNAHLDLAINCCRLIIDIDLLVTVMTGIKLLKNQTQGKDFKYYTVYVRKNGPATCVF